MAHRPGRERLKSLRAGWTVAAAQLTARSDPRVAARAIERMMARAAGRGATFLVTPEMILTGYHGRFDQAVRDRLIAEVLQPACRRHGVTLILGAGSHVGPDRRWRRKPYIQAVVIGSDGGPLGTHEKTIPTRGDLTWCSRGDPRRLRVFRSQGLTFGVTICNDFWATPVYTTLPDLNLPSRLATLGARVIFHAVASGFGRSHLDFHTRRIEERAIRSGAWVVSANAAPDRGRPGNTPTGIVDPRGEWRARAPLTGERLIVGRVDLTRSRPAAGSA